jgi:hypothetical protein
MGTQDIIPDGSSEAGGPRWDFLSDGVAMRKMKRTRRTPTTIHPILTNPDLFFIRASWGDASGSEPVSLANRESVSRASS